MTDQRGIEASNAQALERGVDRIETVTTAPNLEMDEKTSRWIFDPTESLKDLERNFRGLYYNPKTKHYETDRQSQLMNEKGVKKILNILRSHLYKHITLSNLTHDEINLMTLDVTRVIIRLLRARWKEFGVEKHNLSTIRVLCMNTILANLKRAMDSKALEALRGIHTSREVVVPQAKRFGLFR